MWNLRIICIVGEGKGGTTWKRSAETYALPYVHSKMNCPRRNMCWQSKRFYWEGVPGWRALGQGNPGEQLCKFYGDGIRFWVVFSQSFWPRVLPGGACLVVDARAKDSGRWSNMWFLHLTFSWTLQVQFSSVLSDSLRPHRLKHTRPPCSSPTPGVYSNAWPLSQWCHKTISSSVVHFSSHLQSFPASGAFQMSQLFASGGSSIGVST